MLLQDYLTKQWDCYPLSHLCINSISDVKNLINYLLTQCYAFTYFTTQNLPTSLFPRVMLLSIFSTSVLLLTLSLSGHLGNQVGKCLNLTTGKCYDWCIFLFNKYLCRLIIL